VQAISTYTVFISSPSDMAEERQIVEEAVKKFSETYSNRGIAFKTVQSKDVASKFGETAQNVINDSIKGYDIYIGIMGAKFGTQTINFGSGTEEEFYIALDESTKKNEELHVGFLFKEVSTSVDDFSDYQLEQYTLVRKFKTKISTLGLYQTFQDNDILVQHTNKILQDFITRTRGEDSLKAHQSEMLVDSPIRDRFTINQDFYSTVLNSVGADISNNNKVSILLNDIYVPLDLSAIDYEDNSDEEYLETEIVSATALTNYDNSPDTKVIVIGDENSGKTTLTKQLYLEYHANGVIPVSIKGDIIRNAQVKDLLKKVDQSFIDQYNSDALTAYKNLEKSKKLLIIDDLDSSTLNAKHLLKIVNELEDYFSHIFVTVDDIFLLNANISSAGTLSHIDNFNKYKIRDVGYNLRDKIVQRWILAGREDKVMPEELFSLTETYRGLIDKIIGANFVPKKPFVVLVLLQAISGGTSNELAQSSYVRYYKYLIDSTLLGAIHRNKIDIYYGFLPELANFISQSDGKVISDEKFDDLISDYRERKGFPDNLLDDLKSNLISLGVVTHSYGELKFKHSYYYYYFLGQYLKDNISKPEIRDRIRQVCTKLHIKDSSNTIIFLSYHTNDSIIIDSINEVTKNLFAEFDVFDFNDEPTRTLNSLVSLEPETLIESKNKEEEERERLLLDRDRRTEVGEKEPELEVQEAYSTLSKINIAFKSIEIIGQLLKNHYATLDAEPKKELYKKALDLGLRTLNVFIENLAADPEPLFEHLKQQGKNVDVEKNRHRAIFGFASLVVFGVIKNISQATGAYELSKTYEDVISNDRLSIYETILLATKMDFPNEFPIKEMKKLVSSLSNNHLAINTIRGLTVNRLYMRPIDDYQTHQQICNTVGLKINKQILIEEKGRKAS
tara:strand:- start:227 stop:2929 length:2703 start_codon:yes stop_codon:yes gene_type:complete